MVTSWGHMDWGQMSRSNIQAGSPQPEDTTSSPEPEDSRGKHKTSVHELANFIRKKSAGGHGPAITLESVEEWVLAHPNVLVDLLGRNPILVGDFVLDDDSLDGVRTSVVLTQMEGAREMLKLLSRKLTLCIFIGKQWVFSFVP